VSETHQSSTSVESSIVPNGFFIKFAVISFSLSLGSCISYWLSFSAGRLSNHPGSPSDEAILYGFLFTLAFAQIVNLFTMQAQLKALFTKHCAVMFVQSLKIVVPCWLVVAWAGSELIQWIRWSGEYQWYQIALVLISSGITFVTWHVMYHRPRPKLKLTLPRFSLRSLILLVTLTGSGFGLWARWDPWYRLISLTGHEGETLDASYSPSFERIVTVGEDDTARIRDAKTGDTIHILRGHDGISGSFYGPDGSILFTTGEDHIRTWDPETGKALHTLSGFKTDMCCIRFSHSGKFIAATGKYDSFRVWNIRTGKEVVSHTFTGTTGYVAMFSADDRRVANGFYDGTVLVFDMQTGKITHRFKPFKQLAQTTVFAASSRYFFAQAFGPDLSMEGWDLKTNERLEIPYKHPWLLGNAPAQGDTLLIYNNDTAKGLSVRLPGFEVVKKFESEAELVVEFLRNDPKQGQGPLITPDGTRRLYRHSQNRGWGEKHIYAKRRPEYWWGVAWLPEFWLTVVLGFGLVVSVWRDRGMGREPG